MACEHYGIHLMKVRSTDTFLRRDTFDVHTFGPYKNNGTRVCISKEVFDQYCNFEPKIVHLAKDNSKYQQ